MPHFQFIDARESDTLLGELSSHERIGVDTEFMREKTYFAELCLLQLALGEQLYCVDPLPQTLPDSLWSALLDRDWVLHSGRQDLEVVYQAAGRTPESLFDTQIAAALLGYPPQMGYGNLVTELFSVTLDKSHTRTDWSRRPLPQAAIDYAAEDVEYLLPAREQLGERLERAGRFTWAIEDAAELLHHDLYDVSAGDAVDRLKGARNLRGRAHAAAARLAAWREQEALRCNKPRQWILRDNVLLAMATENPATRDALGDISGMPASVVRRAGNDLLALLQEAGADADNYQPPERPDDEQKALLKILQKSVAASAAELQIAAEILAPRKELVAAISGDRQLRVLRGWRGELIGQDLLRLLGDA